jgi:hypothetical protein
VPHRDVLDSFVCFERWEPSTPEIFQKPYIIQFDIAILEYRNRFLKEVILQVALHNYANKIIHDTVPQKNLLGNVEITVIRVFFFIYHKFILTGK